MRTKEEKLKLLNDTVQYYSKNTKRRSINSKGYCIYNGKNSVNKTTGCAIGRLLKPELREKLDNLYENMVEDDAVFLLLPNKVQSYGKYFLSELQRLHDNGIHWDEKGLTIYGLNIVEKIKKDIESYHS